MKGILGVSDEPLVSMDFKGDSPLARSSTPHRPWSSAGTWSRSSPGTTTSGATAAASPTSSRSSPLAFLSMPSPGRTGRRLGRRRYSGPGGGHRVRDATKAVRHSTIRAWSWSCGSPDTMATPATRLPSTTSGNPPPCGRVLRERQAGRRLEGRALRFVPQSLEQARVAELLDQPRLAGDVLVVRRARAVAGGSEHDPLAQADLDRHGQVALGRHAAGSTARCRRAPFSSNDANTSRRSWSRISSSVGAADPFGVTMSISAAWVRMRA